MSLHAQSAGIFGSTSLGVNTTGTAGDASAIFDISSTGKGLLIPRMTTIQRDGITTPATSLMIFNTTASQYEYFNGTAWVGLAVSGTGISSLNGLASASQSFANGATGASPNWSSAGTTHTLNIPLASAAGVSAGLLSKTDYDIFNNKLSSSLTDGNLWIGDGTNTAQQRMMSGDATISNTGVLTIGTGAVTSTKIADGTIADADITNSTITYSKIQNVTASRLLGNSSGAAAAPSEIPLGTGLTFSAGNLIVSGGTLNGGTANYFPKWSSATGLTSTSLLYDDGTNVGIGITNPSAALEIQKPLAPATELLRLRDNTGGKHIEFYSNTMRQRGGNLAFESYESGYTFSTGNPGTVKLAIQFGGNVGIGTTNPQAALDVVGQMYSRSNIIASGSSIDWNLGNNQTLQSATGSVITFTNTQDGGVYYLFITDGTSRTYTFSGTGLTFSFIQPNAATTAGQATFYKFNRIGSSVYVDWGPFGNSPLTGSGTANYISKWSSATGLSASLLYDNGTNAGIGTTSPSHLFHIHETTINPYIHFTDDMTGALSTDGLILGTNGAGSMYLINQETTYDLHIGNSTDNNLITIKGNANSVGIGTTGPATKLDVRTSAGGYAAQFINSETSVSDIGGIYGLANGVNGAGTRKYGGLFQAANGAGTNYGVYGEALTGTGTNIGGYFSASGGSANYAIIVPSTGGNVGIGTTAPTYKLDLRGGLLAIQNTSSINSDDIMIRRPGAASATNINFVMSERSTNTDLWIYGFDGTTYRPFVNFNYSGNKVFFPYSSALGSPSNTMTLDHANYRVGIGIESPTSPLQVNATTSLASGNFVMGSRHDIVGSGGAQVSGIYGWARGGGASGKAIGVAGIADYTNTPTNTVGVYAGFGSTPGSAPTITAVSAAALYADNSGITGAIPGYFNRSSDGTLISFGVANVVQGSINVTAGNVTYNAFTGSHYAVTNQKIERAMLVSMTDDNKHYHGDPKSEILYGVAATAEANNPKVLGAYLGLLDPNNPPSLENPHQIMAVGNGEMWVADNGENICSGDYLISSSTVGHAMKEKGDYEIAYVIGRSAESIDWSEVTEVINGVKHKKISVFFESFTKNYKAEKLQNEINLLKSENASLKSDVEKIKEYLELKTKN